MRRTNHPGLLALRRTVGRRWCTLVVFRGDAIDEKSDDPGLFR